VSGIYGVLSENALSYPMSITSFWTNGPSEQWAFGILLRPRDFTYKACIRLFAVLCW